ncbi:MAG: HigA family addiction module antidote protein [Proteobacteria bacterium]|nr:HigA family addiction module antidote protein [Pseudomonadota bacterium]
MTNLKLPLIHPGKILMEEFLQELDISQYRLAKDISVPPRRINEIVKEKRGITADTALRLGRYFGTSAQFWMNLQNQYELELQEELLENRLEQEVKVLQQPEFIIR